MNILSLSVISLFRQKRKSLLLGFLIAMSCMTAVILVTFVQSQETALDIQFDSYGANILVVPKTDTLNLTYGGFQFGGITTAVEELTPQDMLNIREIPNSKNIRAVAPKLLGTVMAENVSQPLGLAGIDIEQELLIKPWWEWNGELPENDSSLLVGSAVAEMNDWQVGNSIMMGSETFNISGILKPNGNQDDSLVFTSMQTAEWLLDKPGQISLAEVSALCNDCPIDELVLQIGTAIPSAQIKSLRQVMSQKMSLIATFRKYTILLIGIMSLLCGIIIFLAMNGAVADRKKELGILRAVGYLNHQLGQLIILEVLIISLISALGGITAGAFLAYLVLPEISEITREIISIPIVFMVYALLAATGLSLAAALFPAIKAAKVDPVKTLNSL